MNNSVLLYLVGIGILAAVATAGQDKGQFVHQLETLVQAAGAKAKDIQDTSHDPALQSTRNNCFVRHMCKPQGCRRVLRRCKRCTNVYGYLGCLRACPNTSRRCTSRCPRLGRHFRRGCNRRHLVCLRQCKKKRKCRRSCYGKLKACLRWSSKWVKLCRKECNIRRKRCPWSCYTKRVECNLRCEKDHCKKCYNRVAFQRYLCLRPCHICHNKCRGGRYKRCNNKKKCMFLLCRERACTTKRICNKNEV